MRRSSCIYTSSYYNCGMKHPAARSSTAVGNRCLSTWLVADAQTDCSAEHTLLRTTSSFSTLRLAPRCAVTVHLYLVARNIPCTSRPVGAPVNITRKGFGTCMLPLMNCKMP